MTINKIEWTKWINKLKIKIKIKWILQNVKLNKSKIIWMDKNQNKSQNIKLNEWMNE